MTSVDFAFRDAHRELLNLKSAHERFGAMLLTGTIAGPLKRRDRLATLKPSFALGIKQSDWSMVVTASAT